MIKFRIFSAAALLSLAYATPVFAQAAIQEPGGRASLSRQRPRCVVVVGVNDKKLAAGRVLPSQPYVGAHRPGARVVLQQSRWPRRTS